MKPLLERDTWKAYREAKKHNRETDSKSLGKEHTKVSRPDTHSIDIIARIEALKNEYLFNNLMQRKVIDEMLKEAKKEMCAAIEHEIENSFMKRKNLIHSADDCVCCENVHTRGYALKEKLARIKEAVEK